MLLSSQTVGYKTKTKPTNSDCFTRTALYLPTDKLKTVFMPEADISIFTVALSAALPWACPATTHHHGWKRGAHCPLSSLTADRLLVVQKQIQLSRQRESCCSLKNP